MTTGFFARRGNSSWYYRCSARLEQRSDDGPGSVESTERGVRRRRRQIGRQRVQQARRVDQLTGTGAVQRLMIGRKQHAGQSVQRRQHRGGRRRRVGVEMRKHGGGAGARKLTGRRRSREQRQGRRLNKRRQMNARRRRSTATARLLQTTTRIEIWAVQVGFKT